MVPEVESHHVAGTRVVLAGRSNPPMIGKSRCKGAAEAGS